MRIGKVVLGPGAVILIVGIFIGLLYWGFKQLGIGPLGSKSSHETSTASVNTVRIKGSSTINDNVGKDWAQEFMNKHSEARILVESTGSGPGIASLLKGEAEIAAASRPANAKEKEQGKEKSLDLDSPECEHIIGFDAIAVVVNAENPVNQLTVAQLRSIFSGQAKDWNQVGGKAGPITVILRPKELGAYEVFQENILGKDGKFVDGAESVKTNKDLADRIHADQQAISFIAFNDVGSNKALKISATEGTAAVAPSATSIRNRSYLLTRKLYLYTSGTPSGLTKEFIEYALDSGQSLVSKYGFVDMTLKLVKADTASYSSGSASSKTSGSNRQKFNTDLRFRSGSFDPDNLALADLDVISRTLCNSAKMNTLVELVGYADSMGKPEQNKTLSLQRADAVKALLLKKCPRLTLQTSGLGDALPVGDNSSEEGRQLNRRVEIWVTEL